MIRNFKIVIGIEREKVIWLMIAVRLLMLSLSVLVRVIGRALEEIGGNCWVMLMLIMLGVRRLRLLFIEGMMLGSVRLLLLRFMDCLLI